MVLETHMKMCVTEPEKIFFCPQNCENGPKMGQKKSFLNLLKLFVISFYWFCFIIENLHHLLCFCTNPILENFCSWDMGQNVLSQSDCTISPERISEIAYFFACWYKFKWIKSWSKKFGVGVVKNVFGQSGHETQKLPLSQEWIDGIILFLRYSPKWASQTARFLNELFLQSKLMKEPYF